ncbi:MAG: hypothetical protein IJN88_09045 [Clostridia bacterium]|nr:hypothetical protein [Clostridia bacterium]
MIFFKPEKLSEKITKFTALEDNSESGYCLLKSERDYAEIYELKYDSDKPYLVEGLIRSAFNFASLKNIYMGRCSCKNISSFLEKMNFEKNDEYYFNDIPTILTGSCCK